MTLNEKLVDIKPLLDALHEDLLWAAHPFGCYSGHFYDGIGRKYLELDRHAEEIGREVLAP